MAVSNTPAAKTERLMNLTMCLLAARRPLTKAAIRRVVVQYAEATSDEAFDRMFERDKDDLRDLGIPLVTEDVDRLFDDEQGYRIDQRTYALPDIHFEPDELAVVGLASRAWTHAGMAADAAAAMVKLRAIEGEEDAEPFVGLEPHLRTAEPSFDMLKTAVLDRRAVTFDYRTGLSGASRTRHVEPWRLLSFRDRWYVTGRDTDKDEARVYRLSRITSPVTVTGKAGAYEMPADHDARAMVTAAFPAAESTTVTLRIRQGRCEDLRRRATSVSEGEDSWDLIEIEQGALSSFADELAGYGGDVVVEQPSPLREAVVQRLRGALAAHAEDLTLHDAGRRSPGEPR